MSTHAAALELQRSPSVTDSSGCDMTKPVPVDRSLDARLEDSRREWRAVARYMVTLSKDGDWNDTTSGGAAGNHEKFTKKPLTPLN